MSASTIDLSKDTFEETVAATRAQTDQMLKAYRAQWASVVTKSGYQP